MNRIDSLEMTVLDIITAIGEGNPGALTVCSNVYRVNPSVDPDDIFGGLGPLLHLDMLGLYGPDVWMLFRDVCHESLIVMLAVLRANQLGYLSAREVRDAIDGKAPLNLWEACIKVKDRLPAFGATADMVI